MFPFGFLLLFALLAIVIRLIAGGMDGDRLDRYAREQGWTIVERNWTPFGPGWFGSQNERLYDVTYRNRAGETRRAYVKTSALAGVYVTEDRLVEPAPAPPAELPAAEDEATRLRRENDALRHRVAELERRSDPNA